MLYIQVVEATRYSVCVLIFLFMKLHSRGQLYTWHFTSITYYIVPSLTVILHLSGFLKMVVCLVFSIDIFILKFGRGLQIWKRRRCIPSSVYVIKTFICITNCIYILYTMSTCSISLVPAYCMLSHIVPHYLVGKICRWKGHTITYTQTHTPISLPHCVFVFTIKCILCVL